MRTILITGCSSGIGLAAARHFAQRGWKVFAGARTPETATELHATASELGMTVVPVDVTNDESVRTCVARVIEQGGHIEVLVNNAGVGGGGPIEIASLERGRTAFETNYFGAVRMMQAVLPSMRARRSGTIVNITSLAGRLALAAHGHYAASKWALEAASECLASEVKPFGIRVAIIEPGVVLTPIFSKSPTPLTEFGAYQAPVRRLWALFGKQLEKPTQPSDVAEAIEYAVETSEPRLRYLVGNDAVALMAGRAKLTDDEWVAAQGIADDETYYDTMAKLMGEGVFR